MVFDKAKFIKVCGMMSSSHEGEEDGRRQPSRATLKEAGTYVGGGAGRYVEHSGHARATTAAPQA